MAAGTAGEYPKGPVSVLFMAMALLAGAWLLVAMVPAAEAASAPINDSRSLAVNETATYLLTNNFMNGDTIHISVSITTGGLVKVWITRGGQTVMDTGTNSEVDSTWVIPESGDFVLNVENVGTDAGQMAITVEPRNHTTPAQNTDSISYSIFFLVFLIPVFLIIGGLIYVIIKRVRKGEPIMRFGLGKDRKQQMPYGKQYNAPPGLSSQAPDEGLYIPPSEPEDPQQRQ